MRLAVIAGAAILAMTSTASAQVPPTSPAMQAFLDEGRAKGYADGAACTYERDAEACTRQIASLESYIRMKSATQFDREHFYHLLFDYAGDRVRALAEKERAGEAVAYADIMYRRMTAWIGGAEGAKFPTGWIIGLPLQQRRVQALFAVGNVTKARVGAASARQNALRVFDDRAITPAYVSYSWRKQILNAMYGFDFDLADSLQRLINAKAGQALSTDAGLRDEALTAFDDVETWIKRSATQGVDKQSEIVERQAGLHVRRGNFLHEIGESGAAEREYRIAGTLNRCTVDSAYNRLNLPPPPPKPAAGAKPLRETLPTYSTCDTVASNWQRSRRSPVRAASPDFLAALRANPVSVTPIVATLK